MPTYSIRGIDVDFPFDAYDNQIVYMEKVIQSLQEGTNALLESPTGTGKTLCLLCATLAWRKSVRKVSTKLSQYDDGMEVAGTQEKKSDRPKIIYTSRTHSQLKQVIRELKISKYRPKMTVLGSRDQLCIHDDVQRLQGRARDKACHRLCKSRSCSYYLRVSEFTKRDSFGNEPFDIEDLMTYGRVNGLCPYYASRELHKTADIIFSPYNYLIDPKRRGSLTGVLWEETILIFDEAHNLEAICSDAASFDLPSSYITACISEVKECIKISGKRSLGKSAVEQCDPEQFAILKALLLKLESQINEVTMESKELGFTRPGPYIYSFLSDMNITLETANMLISTIDKAVVLLEEENRNSYSKNETVCRLEGFKDILEIIFRDQGTAHAIFYSFHVQESQQKRDVIKGNANRVLSWWCFNPGIAMEGFRKLGIRTIILTSGTLSPLDSFALELKLEFPVRLENPHVISPNQVWIGVIQTGPSGGVLNSSFRNRDSIEYKQELGNAIVNFARIIPDGLLVFFPSYYLMDQCIECWKKTSHISARQQSTIWERICKNKQPVIEPKQSALFAHAIEDFEVKLRGTSTSGAIFFAVCRGKVSEGLDFADKAGRAVVITGMPFATKTDPKVRLKREYLDHQALEQTKDCKVLRGEEWYLQQATRAVNQAVGRVIRHRHDYGAIILCDERFTHRNNQNQISYWMRPHIKSYSVFGDVIFTLTRFFRDRSPCSSLSMKQAENLSMESATKVSIRQTKSKRPASEMLNHLTATSTNDCIQKPFSSILSASDGCISYDMGDVIPANRSNLFNLQDPNLFLSKSGNWLYSQKRSQSFKEKHKVSQHQQFQVIDLTDDAIAMNDPDANFMITPCTSKKFKLLTKDEISPQQVVNKVSYVELETSVNKSSFANKLQECDVPTSSCSSNDDFNKKYYQGGVGVVDGIEVVASQPQGEDNSQSTSSRADDARGRVFLKQVKEKLSIAEYIEFIDFMKALKSKTMKIITVLESIAKLFSTPDRFSLLRRFKDFVPVKYQSFYEKYISASETLINNETNQV